MPTRGPDGVIDTASAEGAPSLAVRTIAGLRALAAQPWLLPTADLRSLTDAAAHAAQVFSVACAALGAGDVVSKERRTSTTVVPPSLFHASMRYEL